MNSRVARSEATHTVAPLKSEPSNRRGCVWRIATRAHFYRSRCEGLMSSTFGTHLQQGIDPIGEARCNWKTANDFLEVLPRSTEYHSQGETQINQAATGVWYRARQCGCQRIERRFAIGRDTDVSGVRPSSESCVRWLLK